MGGAGEIKSMEVEDQPRLPTRSSKLSFRGNVNGTHQDCHRVPSSVEQFRVDVEDKIMLTDTPFRVSFSQISYAPWSKT